MTDPTSRPYSVGDSLDVYQWLVGRDLAVGDPFAREMRNYVYVISDRASGDAVVIDPAYAPQEVVSKTLELGLRIVGAIATHYHADHVGGEIFDHAISGLVSLLSIIDVPVHVHRSEIEWICDTTGLPASSLFGHDSGDTIFLGTGALALIHTPGHTPGSQCIYTDGALITGDTLFLQGCGRTDLPGGDSESLYESLHDRLAAIPSTTAVFPGHAYAIPPTQTMETLRQSNPVLFDVSKQEWIRHFAG